MTSSLRELLVAAKNHPAHVNVEPVLDKIEQNMEASNALGNVGMVTMLEQGIKKS